MCVALQGSASTTRSGKCANAARLPSNKCFTAFPEPHRRGKWRRGTENGVLPGQSSRVKGAERVGRGERALVRVVAGCVCTCVRAQIEGVGNRDTLWQAPGVQWSMCEMGWGTLAAQKLGGRAPGLADQTTSRQAASTWAAAAAAAAGAGWGGGLLRLPAGVAAAACRPGSHIRCPGRGGCCAARPPPRAHSAAAARGPAQWARGP